MSESLRVELTQRSEAIRAAPAPSISNIPDELQGYHTLVLLDQPPPSSGPAAKDRRPNFGAWHSSVYKATSSADGLAYVLRRIESMFPVLFNFHSFVKADSRTDFRLPHESAFGAIEHWSRIRHPNIVSVREAFTTRAFNDNCAQVSPSADTH